MNFKYIIKKGEVDLKEFIKFKQIFRTRHSSPPFWDEVRELEYD